MNSNRNMETTAPIDAKCVAKVLGEYGIQVEIKKVTISSTITTCEFLLKNRCKSIIKKYENDISSDLCDARIMIVTSFPATTLIVEIPNRIRDVVTVNEILSSVMFQHITMKLPLAIGIDTNNQVFITDLTILHHLLIFGCTGQGKTMALYAIITSLLYKKLPNEVKFVLIDPKSELTVFASIAEHYMLYNEEKTPSVLTEINQIIYALAKLHQLMDYRYKLLEQIGAKNIDEYNQKNNDNDKTMPYIVVIIDEFGDLMIMAKEAFISSLNWLAKLGHYVGIHLIITTQKHNVITGTLKANFPGRLSFRVIFKYDSLLILDQPGAEKLTRAGDFLFSSAAGELIRGQGTLVKVSDIEKICRHVVENQILK